MAGTDEGARANPSRYWLMATVAVQAAVIAVFAVLYLHFSFGSFRTMLNSDGAANVLFAKEMLAQHRLFPQWNHSTGIFMPLIMPHLLLMPALMPWLHDGFTAFRVAVAVDQLVMFVLLAWLLGRMGLSLPSRLFVVALLVVSPSLAFLFQTTLLAGKAWTLVFLLLVVLLCHEIAHTASRRRLARIALLVLVGGAIFADVANCAMILPGLVVALVLDWLTQHRRDTARIGIVLAVLAGAVVVGQILLHTLMRGNHYAPYSPVFVSPTLVGQHLATLAAGLLELFGAVPVGATTYSVSGMASGCKFLILLLALAMPFWLVARHRRLANPLVRVLAIVCVVSLTIRLYVYLFTGISVGSPSTARYFIVELLLGLVLVLFHVETQIRETWLRMTILVGALIPFALTSPLLHLDSPALSPVQQLTRQLEDRGLAFGYATFWNANAPTVLSNGRVTVRQVEADRGRLVPERWLSSDRWYEGPVDRESFLLLSDEELTTVDLPLLEATAGAPSRTVEWPGYTALVYPFNLASRLHWDQPTDEPVAPADRHVVLEPLSQPEWNAGTHAWLLRWRVRNTGNTRLTSYGTHPVNLGLHLLDPSGRMQEKDFMRFPILVQPGASADVETRVPAARLSAGDRMQAEIVQEGVAWFGSPDNPAGTAEITIPPVPGAADVGPQPATPARAPAPRAGPPGPPRPPKAGSARR